MQFDTNRIRFWTDDPISTMVVGAFLAIFLCWRLFGDGTFAKDEILAIIEEDYVVDYRYDLYEQAKLEDSAAEGMEISEYWQKMGDEIDVTFSNVSIAAPLLKWQANEPVVVNFDYKLLHNGETVKSEKNKYLRVQRAGDLTYPSGPFSYYLKKFI